MSKKDKDENKKIKDSKEKNSKTKTKKEIKAKEEKKNSKTLSSEFKGSHKEKVRKERKQERDYFKLKRVAKVVTIVCVSIVVIELILMFLYRERNENQITYNDTLYSVESINDEYYLAVGSSNFKHSKYNDPFIYEYQDGIQTDKINRVYAEQAKLVKYDKNLNLVFEKTFKTKYDSTFYDVKVVGDKIIAVGSYVKEEKQLSLNTRDGLIAKYDLDGNFLSSENYQILGDTEFKKIVVVDDGYLLVGQSIYENMEIGNHDQGGGIILKYDMDGKFQWKSNFGGNKSGILEDVIKVDDGYIACGKDAYNYGMLIKFDLNGNRKWVKNYENTDQYGMYDIELKDDKLYIASAMNVSDEVTESGDKVFKYDACIFVYDLNGELVDTFSIKGNNDDRFNSIMLLDDKIIAVGYTKSSDIKITGINYQKDMSEGMIVEFDYNGKILKTATYGGKKNEILNDIILAIPDTADKINNTNPYIIVGYTNSKRNLFKGNNKDYYSKILKYNDKLELLKEK